MNRFTSVYFESERRIAFICDQTTGYKKTYIDISSNISDVLILYFVENTKYKKKFNELFGLIRFYLNSIERNRNFVSEYNYDNIILEDLIKKNKNRTNGLFVFEVCFLYPYQIKYFHSQLYLNNLITSKIVETNEIISIHSNKISIQTYDIDNIDISLSTLIFIFENHNKPILLKKHIVEDIYFVKMVQDNNLDPIEIINEIISSYPNIYFNITI